MLKCARVGEDVRGANTAPQKAGAGMLTPHRLTFGEKGREGCSQGQRDKLPGAPHGVEHKRRSQRSFAVRLASEGKTERASMVRRFHVCLSVLERKSRRSDGTLVPIRVWGAWKSTSCFLKRHFKTEQPLPME